MTAGGTNMTTPEPARTPQVGDRVRVRSASPYTPIGRISGLLGPLGPGGAMVYEIRYKRKPRSSYTELLAEHFDVLPPKPAASPGGEQRPADVAQEPQVQPG